MAWKQGKELVAAMRQKNQIDPGLVREIDGLLPASIGVLQPVKWEYKSLVLERTVDLNDLGLDEWELVTVIPQPGDMAVFYLRRQKA